MTHKPPSAQAERMRKHVQAVQTAIEEVILGKASLIQKTLTCLLAGGHLLLEDQPGVGKTTLAHTLAKALGLEHKRVQFTSDLLPADVLGASIFRQHNSSFEFQAGPVFTQVLLADEINRAPPKTQSALLEAMEEQQVSIDGETHTLPSPFFVIATQNPLDAHGVFPLPESQLDRFLMRLSIGYPEAEAELDVLAGGDRRELINALTAAMAAEQLLACQQAVRAVETSLALRQYVQALLNWSRTSGHYRHGLSTRAGLALIRAAQAWAWLAGRDYVLPEDVQTMLPAVVGHRLQLNDDSLTHDSEHITKLLRNEVAIP